MDYNPLKKTFHMSSIISQELKILDATIIDLCLNKLSVGLVGNKILRWDEWKN